MLNLIDTHAHLDHIENLNEALAEAAKTGISAVLAVSTSLQSMKRNLQIKRECASPAIYLGLGIHPSLRDTNGGDITTEELEDSYTFIKQNIKQANVIGEIGLDFSYPWVLKDSEKKQEQREVFRRQLAIAQEFKKPVVVHTRGTWEECLAMVEEFKIKQANFHWYSGSVDVLEDILKNGYYVSFGPALALNRQLREAMSHAPIEQTLIETDSPVYFNYPEAMGGGFKSTPKDIFKALEAYAKLKEIALEQAAQALNKNAKNFIEI